MKGPDWSKLIPLLCIGFLWGVAAQMEIQRHVSRRVINKKLEKRFLRYFSRKVLNIPRSKKAR